MSDETKKPETHPTPGADGGNDATEASKTFTQAELEDIIGRRLGKYKSLESELEQIRSERDKLARAEKERKEAEMSELEKVQAEAAELKSKIGELDKYRIEYEEREKVLAEKIEKEAEGLSDDDRALLGSISGSDAKLSFINRLKSAADSRTGLPNGKGGKTSEISLEDITKKRIAGDRTWREDYEKYRKSR